MNTSSGIQPSLAAEQAEAAFGLGTTKIPSEVLPIPITLSMETSFSKSLQPFPEPAERFVTAGEQR